MEALASHCMERLYGGRLHCPCSEVAFFRACFGSCTVRLSITFPFPTHLPGLQPMWIMHHLCIMMARTPFGWEGGQGATGGVCGGVVIVTFLGHVWVRDGSRQPAAHLHVWYLRPFHTECTC